MIVNKLNKGYETRSDFSNFNWLKNDEWYLVPDNSELANKIKKLYPRYEFVLDGEENLIDVVEIPKTEDEIKKERIEEIKSELQKLDSVINRATEDIYILTNLRAYDSVEEVIFKKEELRKELSNLKEALTNA